MPGRRTSDFDARNLEERMRDVERIANESRSEFRTISGDLKKDFKEFRDKITASVDSLKESISTYKIKVLSDDREERKDVRVERWKFYGVISVAVISAAVSVTLNWDRAEVMVSSIKTHFVKVGNAKVPGMIDPYNKTKKRRAKRKKALPPIVVPAEPKEDENEAVGN